jgi:hypothetical protein
MITRPGSLSITRDINPEIMTRIYVYLRPIGDETWKCLVVWEEYGKSGTVVTQWLRLLPNVSSHLVSRVVP